MSLSVPIVLAGPEASVVPLGNASLIALIRLRKCSRCGGFPTARPGERREFDAGVPTASRAERIGARGRRDAAARCSSEGVDETARHGDDALGLVALDGCSGARLTGVWIRGARSVRAAIRRPGPLRIACADIDMPEPESRGAEQLAQTGHGIGERVADRGVRGMERDLRAVAVETYTDL